MTAQLDDARAKEKAARRLRAAGNDQDAIEAYEEARELYAESGLQYSRDSVVADAVMGAIKRCDAIVSNIRHPKEKRAAAAVLETRFRITARESLLVRFDRVLDRGDERRRRAAFPWHRASSSCAVTSAP